MEEFIYRSKKGEGYPPFRLYKLVEGHSYFVKDFDDKEEMLQFIENEYEFAKLYINLGE